MVSITTAQQNQAAKIFEDAMTKAAVSFSKWLNAEITSERVQLYTAIADSSVHPCSKNGHDLHLLVTPLLGDVPGRSYLVLDRNDRDILLGRDSFRKALPDEQYNTAVLMETDNILSAAFVTVLANALQISCFGDVPESHSATTQVVNELIRVYIPNGPVSLVMESSFRMKGNPSFAPQFIWKFSADRIFAAVSQMSRPIPST